MALPLFAGSAQAQEQPARLQGVVVLESTFEPIHEAVVTLIGTDIETRTGIMGDFAIHDPPLGMAWVRVAVPGLPAVREQVQISETGVIFLQFRMPEDVTALLDDVLVDVAARGTDYADVETALDMVAARVPSINMRTSGDVGNNDAAVRLRGFTSLTQNGDPLIVIDDVVARGAPPLQILSEIPASDVDSIQILKGPAAAFRYPWAANGVIRVTTRKN
jgi:outer membrane receptor protein involved in Fe transport